MKRDLENLGAVQVEIKRIVEHCNPLESPVWHLDRPVRASLVRDLVTAGVVNDRNYTAESTSWTEEDHAARIAYFLVHGWDQPIHIDVGVPLLRHYEALQPTWFVIDGNHRLTAAIIRGDQFIYAEVSGSWDVLKCLLGIDLEKLSHEAA